MKKSRRIAKSLAVVAAAVTLAAGSIPVTAFAYGEEVDVSTSTFKSDTDSSAEFQEWRTNVWDAGASANSGNIALTPGETEKDLNFAWYSVDKGVPAVRVWKAGQDMSTAKVFAGTATAIEAENWQGSTYSAANKVTIEGYFEKTTKYYYQYTSKYTNGSTVWSDVYTYSTADENNFSVILTGDPQIGASGSSDDNTATDTSAARDTYNWNITMETALEVDPDAAFLLSAGDQIDKSGATKDTDKKTRESEYAGYFYPEVFRSLPVASTIGNHDMAGDDYSNHFNNPNSEDKLGATAAGGDYYFSYGDVLFVSLNSNNRNQEEHRELLTKAVASNPDAAWKVVIFHSDIYGSGEPHADTDAAQNRIIFAPLMDEFDIDVCLTGHDHTYSRSYQILDGNVIDYDISDGSVTDPEGTLYITTGSGSGSKYYNLLNYTPYYIADRTNVCLPAFSTIDFTATSFTIKTYDYTGAKYAEDFTIKKSGTAVSVEKVIEDAEAVLESIDITKYTADSVAALETAVADLKSLQNTTAEDPMVSEIVTKYNTSEDRISGYGSVKDNADKDLLSNGKYANRLAKGISTLLDKTIYSQISDGVEIAEPVLPIIDAAALNTAKEAVYSAIDALELIEEPATEEETTEETTEEITTEEATKEAAVEETSSEQETTLEQTTGDETSAEQTVETTEEAATKSSTVDNGKDNTPDTGDNVSMAVVFGCLAAMMFAVVIAAYVLRRKEQMCRK